MIDSLFVVHRKRSPATASLRPSDIIGRQNPNEIPASESGSRPQHTLTVYRARWLFESARLVYQWLVRASLLRN